VIDRATVQTDAHVKIDLLGLDLVSVFFAMMKDGALRKGTLIVEWTWQ
jgi:hypothetical protein